MFRSVMFRYALVFIASMVVGAAVYLGAVGINHNFGNKEKVQMIGDLLMREDSLAGELNLFAVTEKPVDLGFDSRGFFYFLNQNGEIIQCIRSEETETQLMTKFYRMQNSKFLEDKGCSAIAFHPDYLVHGTQGYGKFYLACAEKKDSGLSFEEVENETHQEVIYELTNTNMEAERFSGPKREVMRLSVVKGARESILTDLTFDQRGFLYIGVTDTPDKSRAADVGSLYGKVLRIDPLEDAINEEPYTIPRSNPFYYVKDSLPELWSYGLHNPHTINHDSFHNWICISDTGKEMYEEINLSNAGAEFFGWDLAEGSFFTPASNRQPVTEGVTTPQVEYSRETVLGRNIGGIIYRGERFPQLDGKTIFADEDGRLMTAQMTPGKKVRHINLLIKSSEGGRVKAKSLKEGPSGEMYMLCDTGEIYELQKSNPYKSWRRGAMMACVLK